VNNAEEMKAGLAGDRRPEVTEVGDFVYKEVRRKEMINPIRDEINFGR
jgi:hypothetical protein